MNRLRYSLVFLSLLIVGCGDKKDEVISSAEEVHNSSGTLNAELLGTVVAEPGLFDGFFTDKGFAIAMPSGGVYVISQALPSLRRGDTVKVVGTTTELYQMRVIQLTSSETAGDFKYTPAVVDIAVDQMDEYYVGRLVQIEGVITELKSDLPYGWKLFIRAKGGKESDTALVFISSTSKIDPRTESDFKEGENIEITGFFIKYKDELRLLPRDMKDIKFLGSEAAPE